MKTLLSFFTFVVMIFISEISFAQVTFQKTYGGIDSEVRPSIQQTKDKGYIIGGYTWSYGSGNSDYYLVKIDANGDILWTKTFGGVLRDEGYCQDQTADGGYVIAGSSENYGAGDFDVYLIKTDSSGNYLWSKTYGGLTTDRCYSIQQTSDGGYILGGGTYSFGTGDLNVFLIKTDANGDTVWIKTFGGTNTDCALAVQQTTDGGYILTGFSDSFGAGYNDIYIIKTDAFGSLQWSKTLGGIYNDDAISIQQTNDGGYIINGSTTSFSAPPRDAYLIKIDSTGNPLWTKTYGSIGDDVGWTVMQTLDGGYLVGGGANSFDTYLIKTDLNGDTLWTKTYGGTGIEYINSVQQTNDGGYIFAGITKSFGSGDYDFYLIKTDSNGISVCNEKNTSTIVTAPATQVTSPATIVISPPIIVHSPITLVGSGGIVTTLCTTVGTQSAIQNSQFEISISPNPFHSTTTLAIPNNLFNDHLTLSIFNVEGKILRQQNVTSHQTIIERNGLADGLYFYKLAENGIVKSVGKLIIE